MKLRVKETNGRLHTVEADPHTSFDRFRELVHKVVPGIAPDAQKLVFNGRLLEAETLKATGVKDGDILVVLATRPRPRGASTDHLEAMPTARTILAATQRKASKTATENGLKKKKKKRRSSKRRDSIRPRALSLIGSDGDENTTTSSEAGASPAVSAGDGLSPIAGGQQQRRRRRLPKVPGLALRGLVEMGFTSGRARKALLLNGMNTQAAMEWLLIHGEDEDIDSPITERQRQHILENERNFVLDEEAARQLGEMGFSGEDVARALRYSRNNQDSALAWLLSDRQDEEQSDGEEDGGAGDGDEDDFGDDDGNEALDDEEGDDATNEVLRAIMSNPDIRSGLQSERVVRALERVMQNPHAAMEYLNDPEIGPIILQIHSIISNPQAMLGLGGGGDIEGLEEGEEDDFEDLDGGDDLGPLY